MSTKTYSLCWTKQAAPPRPGHPTLGLRALLDRLHCACSSFWVRRATYFFLGMLAMDSSTSLRGILGSCSSSCAWTSLFSGPSSSESPPVLKIWRTKDLPVVRVVRHATAGPSLSPVRDARCGTHLHISQHVTRPTRLVPRSRLQGLAANGQVHRVMASYSMNGATLHSGGNHAANDPNHQDAPEYSLSGVLHFLQSEWRRYERDRNSWAIERAELRVGLQSDTGAYCSFGGRAQRRRECQE